MSKNQSDKEDNFHDDEEKKAEEDRKRREKESRSKAEKAERESKVKRKRAPYKSSLGLRVFNLLLGLVFIGLSFYALANEDLTVYNAVLLLGVILLLSGISRIINAFYDKDLGGTKRIIRFLIGSFLILIAVIIFISPDFGDLLLYFLLGIGLIAQGSGRLLTGITHAAYPLWVKATQVLMGIASVLIGVTAVIPNLADVDYGFSLLTLLVIGFFISGLSRLVLGLVGLNEGKTK